MSKAVKTLTLKNISAKFVANTQSSLPSLEGILSSHRDNDMVVHLGDGIYCQDLN